MTIQVLTQAREHLIDRTIESLDGAPNAILHLYNSAVAARRKADRDGVKQIAVDGAKMVADRISKCGAENLRLQYSPESFTGTESLRARGLRGGDGRMEVDGGEPDHHQPSGDGNVDAEHRGRPDRVDAPPFQQARGGHPVATCITTAAAPSPRPSSA